MIPRDITPYIERSITKFPVLAIIGPRQSGKTTLLQHLFKGYQYVSLENPESRAFAQENPKGFLETQSYLIYGGEQNQKRRQAVVRKWDDFSL